MQFLLLLTLVPLAACHYGNHGKTHHKEAGYGDIDYEYEDLGKNLYPKDDYTTDYRKTGNRHPRKNYYGDMPPNPPPMGPPPSPNLGAIYNTMLSKALYPSGEKTINLKVSGQIDVVKSFKNPHGMHGGHGDYYKHLHNVEKQHGRVDVDDDDEEEEDYGSWWKNRTTCPFWITKQFLKLCKCKTINGMIERVTGHKLEPLPNDPMKVFNNTPGIEELKVRKVNTLLTLLEDMKPEDMKKLFFAGMIDTMCHKAKNFVREVEMFEKAAHARARAHMSHPAVNRNLVQPERKPLSKIGLKNQGS